MAGMARGAVAGLLLGVAWGVIARVFMRLLSTEPSFSWSGTLFIVGLCAVAGAMVGLVRAARTGGRTRWWRLAGVPALAVVLGPGMVLLPAALGYALVLRGGRVLRVLGTGLVAVPAVFLVSQGFDAPGPATTAQLAGLALMTLAAAPLGWGVAELGRRWRTAADPRPAPALAAAPEVHGQAVPAVGG